MIKNYDLFTTLGDAKKAATSAVKRDECTWIIDRSGSYFKIHDEYHSSQYSSWEKSILKISPRIQVSSEAILLSPDEKALVAAVLDPSEPGRDYYEGTEKTKRSLWAKLTNR